MIKSEMLKALFENKCVESNCMYEYGGLFEFQRCFETWHTGILITKITYYQTEFGNNCFGSETKPFVIINNLGFFDNIPNFARRLHNEVFLSMENPKENPPTKVSINLRGNTLEISVKGETVYELQATFISKNQEAAGGGEILKFEIN